MWRRGVSAILADSGFVASEINHLASWRKGRNGIAAIAAIDDVVTFDDVRRFRDDHRAIPVIAVLPELDVSSYAVAIRSGATAALGGDEPAEALIAVLETAFLGRAAVPDAVVKAMAARIPNTPAAEAWIGPGQAEWLRHLAKGEPVSELAEAVGYSEREMFRMLHDLYVKIGVRGRTEAIIWATRHGVLDEESTEG